MPEGRKSGERLRRAYFLLAAFEVLTVVGALYLTHRLTTMFDGSLALNWAWQLRVRTYSTLDNAAASARANVDNLFVTGDIAKERRAFTVALATFDRLTGAAREEARTIANPGRRARILADFEAIETARARAGERANRVFDSLTQGRREDAQPLIVQSDAGFVDTNDAIVRLQNDSMAIAIEALEEQEREAASLRSSETIIGTLIVVMVIAAALYGRRMSARMRESEQALRRTEERFQLAARATNDALWDWDLGSGAFWWNDAFAEQFGHKGERASLEVWKESIHPDDRDRVDAGLTQFLKARSDTWNAEYRMRQPQGGYGWVLDRGFVVREDDGTARRMISSLMDITARKEAERRKSDFVSFVSHQLRTPLSGMSWMLELAADAEGLPGAAREYIADARDSASRLATLVNDLLDIAKLESGRLVVSPERLALPKVTDAVVAELSPLASDKGLTLDVAMAADIRPVFADAQLMRQVVLNLLSNAMKYTPPGGRIDVALTQQDGSLTWSVRDTGVGVPKAAQSRLFEKFFRADNAVSMETEGTGLGLHLVRLIVEQAGGRVWCESEEGHGATFAFTMPVMAEKGTV